jgi:protein TonB
MIKPPAPLGDVVGKRDSVSSIRNIFSQQFFAPRYIPTGTPLIDDRDAGSAPDLSNVPLGRGGIDGIPNGLGNGMPVVTPKPPPPAHPIKISHWAEGNLIYRVQPQYPPLARQARIQGAVQLRAVISKAGTIERLTLESGHPMLAGAAVDAVRQWRYRPYLLNDEPVEIETEITVNFVLSGN